MATKNKTLYSILGVVGAIVLIVIAIISWRISVRNGIITADQAVEKAWGDVENYYQRRLDLIPNLVNTVKGYATHESETLETVTAARAGVTNSADNLLAANEAAKTNPSPENYAALDRQYSIYVNAVHEAYPDLKANTNFLSLQDELAGTENRIATARRDYNKAVEVYNNKILRFPGSMFASGFEKRDMFKASAEAATAPTVQF